MSDLQDRIDRALVVVKTLNTLYPTVKIALNYTNQLELIVAVILSAQCTDKKVNEVTTHLFKKYKTVDDYADAQQEVLGQDIRSTGFYQSKAKNLIGMARKLRENFGGELPETVSELITLPGVARKTANVVLHEAFNEQEGIAVDTHVMRLANKFRLTTEKDPVKIERDLMLIIPRQEWGDFSLRLVQYGRDYSPAHKVHSQEDPISQALLKLKK